MLVQANRHLIVNPDLIVAASWDQTENMWRIFVAGHNKDTPVIRLTSEEMSRILSNVEMPKMLALLNAAKTRGAKSQPHPPRTPGGKASGQ